MASHRKSRRSKPNPLSLATTPTARAALTLALAGAASLASLQGSAHAQPRTPSPGEQIKSTVDRIRSEAAATASSSHLPNGSNADGARQTRDTAPAQSADPTEPAQPAQPAASPQSPKPAEPAEPPQTVKQAQPPKQVRPAQPAKSPKHAKHSKPSKPSKPAASTKPSKPAKQTKPAKPTKTKKQAKPAKTSVSGRAARAVAFARQALGKPYVWGATGPSGFDCSGLTLAAWKAAGVTLPRTTYTQINAGKRVARSALRPGDLVFFYSSRSHVGLYIGGGRMIHAPRPGASVRVAPIDQMPFAGATRPG
ncbi:C40 family peptidase [Streptomyces sp. NPDC048172]|uniref:C40 family peptidase n=1 Tax=Streptomyces sp. NPDC048172 TaxID=3365505 RepID=UPI00372375FD